MRLELSIRIDANVLEGGGQNYQAVPSFLGWNASTYILQ